MLLDLFKQKQAAKPSQPAGPLPKPAAQQQPQPAQQAKPLPQQPQAQPQPAAQQQARPIAQQPAVGQGAVPINSSITVDDIYPIIVRKIKDEFKNVAGEAEKLKEIDTKIEKVSKSFEDFKKFVDDSKTRIEELKGKTEKFDVALYELLTNQFNPFIKKSPEQSAEGAQQANPNRFQERNYEKAKTIDAIENPSPKPIIKDKEEKVEVSEQKQDIGDRIRESQSIHIEKEAESTEQKTGEQMHEPEKEKTSAAEPISQQEYEEELKNVLQNTKNDLFQSQGGEKMPNLRQQEPLESQSIKIHDNISNTYEEVSIPKQNPAKENEFISQSKNLVPGVKRQLPEISADASSSQDRQKIKEQILVEDVLDVPKEGSESHEVSETLSFKETWNDPDAQHLDKTPPKLKRFDLKELLGKFLNKHDPKEKTLDEFENKDTDFSTTIEPMEIQKEPKKEQKPEERSMKNQEQSLKEKEDSEGRIIKRVSAEEQILNAEKQRIIQVNVSDPRQYFWFSNGKVAKNIPDFIMVLKELDEEIFRKHVGLGKNDFANWIRGVFHSDIVANVVSHCKNRDEIIKVLE